MLNNRDEKFEAPEESEYHFSDEEVSYEVEPETTKSAAAAPAAGPGGGIKNRLQFLNRLTQSKRMMISLGVFLVLIFVVYKMVTPTATTPSTQITPVVTAETQQKTIQAAAQKQVSNLPQNPALPPTTYNIPANQAAPTTAQVPTAPAQVSNIQEPPQVPVVAPQQPMAAATPVNINIPKPTQPQTMPQQPAVAMTQPQPVQSQQTMQLPPNMPGQPMMQQPTQQVQPTMQQMPTTTVTTQTTQMQPMQMQPVQTQTMQQQPSALTALGSQIPGGVDARIASIAAENQQLMAKLQQENIQRINDFSTQTKAMQDQIVALNTRVGVMEKEINQLVQALTHQGGVSSRPTHSQPPPQPVEVRVPYNVQAIIPGRAWLRADNGETVTVAEGDVIKDLGRVTKIDPYDGVVEINTGSKLISLSYGTGG